jgi:hypothetical protein
MDKLVYLDFVRNHKWFGYNTPISFNGFNSDGNWPFWSSDSITNV